MNTSEFDDVMVEFITESRENLDDLDTALVTLEQHPDPGVIAKVFRAVHTIKGTSGFLGLRTLESVTHLGENLLSKMRDGALPVTEENTTALLGMADVVRSILDCVEATGGEGAETYPALIEELNRLNNPEEADTSTAGRRSAKGCSDASVTQLKPRRTTSTPPAKRTAEVVDEQPVVKPADVVEVLQPEAEERQPSNESIRVDVGLLDDLMNLVGQLVIARNQILQFNASCFDPSFAATSERLNLITSELQERVMKTRMQPIDNIWNKFPRIVRDLSLSCGKNARLEMEGKHTEVDKTLLEAIKDPLTHLIRNAVDHGLETPEVRLATGKPAEGAVRLSAYHQGGQVIIEIADDGAGIDADIVRRKAIQKGVLTADEAAILPDCEIVNVIFQPGFSTVDQVSNISGRGVGMDVVKTNIEAIGGTVDVQTVVGRGTTFKVRIPLRIPIVVLLGRS